jgi:SAM-dependent methyltransferase
MTAAYDWRGDVGDVWAEEWRRTDRSLAPVNDALVAEAVRIGGRGAPDILDIGCGAGATSLALAEALPEARITGLDLSESLVAVARERASGRARLRFEAGDAAGWRPNEAGFDLIVSRHGVMFFEDPVAAFRNLRALLRPGGHLLFSCFRGRGENEWVRAMRPLLERFAPDALGAPEPPVGPFAFADPARVDSILREAGFVGRGLAPLDFAFTAGAGADPIGEALSYFRRIGPIAVLLRGLDEAARAAAFAQLTEIVAAHRSDDRVAFDAAAWIVAGERP